MIAVNHQYEHCRNADIGQHFSGIGGLNDTLAGHDTRLLFCRYVYGLLGPIGAFASPAHGSRL